ARAGICKAEGARRWRCAGACGTVLSACSTGGGAKMNLGFFTVPIHPLDKDLRQSLREDREAFVLADELSFTESYVGEHTTDQAENITSCISFLAWIATDIRRMRLGTGTVNLPNAHPAAVASQVAMLDHMLDG